MSTQQRFWKSSYCPSHNFALKKSKCHPPPFQISLKPSVPTSSDPSWPRKQNLLVQSTSSLPKTYQLADPLLKSFKKRRFPINRSGDPLWPFRFCWTINSHHPWPLAMLVSGATKSWSPTESEGAQVSPSRPQPWALKTLPISKRAGFCTFTSVKNVRPGCFAPSIHSVKLDLPYTVIHLKVQE